MKFSKIIDHVKKEPDARVRYRRKDWYDDNYIFYSNGFCSKISKNTAPAFYIIFCEEPPEEYVFNAEDLLAEDWEIQEL